MGAASRPSPGVAAARQGAGRGRGSPRLTCSDGILLALDMAVRTGANRGEVPVETAGDCGGPTAQPESLKPGALGADAAAVPEPPLTLAAGTETRLACGWAVVCGESLQLPVLHLGPPSWPPSLSSPKLSPAALAHRPVTTPFSAGWDVRSSSLTSLSHRWAPGGEQKAVEMCRLAHGPGATPPWSWSCGGPVTSRSFTLAVPTRGGQTTLLKSQGASLWPCSPNDATLH